jgi:hypothetical protein
MILAEEDARSSTQLNQAQNDEQTDSLNISLALLFEQQVSDDNDSSSRPLSGI